jgi:NRPS condensation-like uncharacterized protein
MNRPLSTLEKAFWLEDQAANQNWVMIANLSMPVPESLLRQALDCVQQRHPPLKCKFKDGEIPAFTTEDVPPIPLRIIERKGENHWVEESDTELLEPIPWTEGPLLRAVLLSSQDKCDLLMTACHIVADGISGVIIMRNVLRVLDKLLRGEPVDEPPLPECPSTPDFLRKDLKYTPGFLDISGRIKRFLFRPVGLSGNNDGPVHKRTSHIIPRFLSETEAKKLMARCKQEKTTVQGAICAALLQTLVEEIRKTQNVRKKGPLFIGCLTPINARHYFSRPVGEDIGNFISDAVHYQFVDENASLWSVARKAKKSLQREIKFGRDIETIRSVGDILELCSTPLDIFNKIVDLVPPVFITNVGKLDIPEEFGDLTLEDLHFNANITPAARDGFAIIVTTFRGRMNLEFLYAAPYISKGRAKILVEGVLRRLRDAF